MTISTINYRCTISPQRVKITKEFGDSVQFNTWVCFQKIFDLLEIKDPILRNYRIQIWKHKKNEFEFGQVPHNNQAKYLVKINGATEFSEIINEDWLWNWLLCTHISLAILKPIVAQSYKRVRIFTSDREHLLTDGEIRNLRLEKIGDFNPRFYKYNCFNGL